MSNQKEIEQKDLLIKSCFSLNIKISDDKIEEIGNTLLFGNHENVKKHLEKYKTYDSFTRAQLGYVFAYIMSSLGGYVSANHPLGHFRKGEIEIPIAFVGWSGTIKDSGISFAINPECFASEKPRLIYCDDYLNNHSETFSCIVNHIEKYSSGIGGVCLTEINEYYGKLGIEFTLDHNFVKDNVLIDYKWRSTKEVGDYIISLPRCGEFNCSFGELGIFPSNKVVRLVTDSFCMK